MNGQKPPISSRQWSSGGALLFGLLFVLALACVLFLNKKNEGKILITPIDRLLPPTVTTYPAQVLPLTNWKITLPISFADNPKEPLEISQPELATYQANPWFTTTSDEKGVIFRAPVNGITTNNSGYPRSELREMALNGAEDAYWSSKEGRHTLYIEQAITAVPKGKPEVVAGQAHGDDDDLLAIRLDHPKLYLARNKKNLATLDEHYVLGKRFSISFVASDGMFRIFYNGSDTPVYTLDKEVDKAYFKAGVYTQSNCETEEDPELCTADNYGEVVIYRIQVGHE